MVEAPIRAGYRRSLAALGALLALGILATIAGSGRTPGTKRYVPFEAAGLMLAPPDQIDRVELAAAGRRLVLVRTTLGAWAVVDSPGLANAAAFASHVDAALRFMHGSAPTRVLRRDEYESDRLGEFGLDPPGYIVVLFAGGKAVLNAAFGSPNPMRTSQYVRVEGREELYLLPGYVGREWERVIGGLPRSAGAS